MTPIRGFLLVLAAAPALSGCLVIGALNAGGASAPATAAVSPSAARTGTSPSPSVTAPSTSGTGSPTTTPTPTATTAPVASPPALPAGTKWATVASEQVRFAVAAGWVEINPEAMASASGITPEVKKLAKDLGISTAELLRRFDSIEVAYLAGPVSGYSSNISVSTEPLSSLPEDEWVTKALTEGGKLKVLGIEHFDTSVGPALRVNATATLKGYTIPTATVVVDVGRHCLIVEVAARKRADVDQAVSRAMTTLHAI